MAAGGPAAEIGASEVVAVQAEKSSRLTARSAFSLYLACTSPEILPNGITCRFVALPLFPA